MGFDELYGNDPVKRSLKRALFNGHISNSYVFEGISGVGKRLCANIFARALVCKEASPESRPCEKCPACVKARSNNHPDIVRLVQTAGKSSIGVDDVREQILSEVYLKPYLAKRRVFIIGDGDLLSDEAQNALLKVLEEPPENVTFITCVTKQDKLLDTVLSRSSVMSFFPLSFQEVSSYLANHFETNENIELAARLSQGSIGAAVSFMAKEGTEKRFHESIAHISALNRNAAMVRQTADFMIEEKENISDIIDFMSTFIRDCVYVKSGLESRVIYRNKLSEMRVFIEGISKKGLVHAFDRLTDFKLRIRQNLNYNASVSETVMRIWEDFHDEGSGHKV